MEPAGIAARTTARTTLTTRRKVSTMPPSVAPVRRPTTRAMTNAVLIGALLLGATCVAPTLAAAQCAAPFDRGDADGDGMVNHFEITVGTNACDPDTDHDGLNDQQEVVINGTNPFAPDTDGDGMGDWYELNTGTDPLVNNNVPAPAPAPPDPAPGGRADRDGDQLYDDDETNVYGTNPDVFDSDGDGVGDGEEDYLGTDPLDPND